MQISGLTLANFRCFEFIELSLSPSFTLLLGDNGAGKTALLEGLAVALGAFVGEIRDAQSRNIREADDARHVVFDLNGVPDLQTQWPVRVAVLGTLFGERIGWARELSGTGGKTTRKESADLHESTEAAGRLIRRGKPIELPVLAFYGTQRLWVLKKATEAKRGVGSRLDGYIDCLAPASNVRLMAQWMYQQTLADLQAGAPSAQLAALERSVCLCLGDVTRFWFDIRHHEVRLQFVDGKVTPFSQLSDGYRNVIALVADLAWRAAVLNPHHGADRPGPLRILSAPDPGRGRRPRRRDRADRRDRPAPPPGLATPDRPRSAPRLPGITVCRHHALAPGGRQRPPT